ncbi:MAG: lipocalin-like domain-containing protein [Candidatus Eremiobacterota bacterium]
MTGRILWLLGLSLLACGPATGPVRASLSVQEAVGGDVPAGYAQADRARELVFPADHGPHPDFRSEWWYFTGNLDGQRPFGYQLSFFRSNLNPMPERRRSDWGTNQVALAHFAVTDVRGGKHRGFELASRAALGLAGFQASPLRVWLDDWEAAGSATPQDPLHLRASTQECAVDLQLWTERPPVLHGDGGLSAKGEEPGQASYYVSFTRLATRGYVRSGGQTYPVEGLSWMDHEWTSNALGREQSGWDWMGLQLQDGRDVMLFQLRRPDGSVSFRGGTLVESDGRWRPLEARLERLATRGAYPSKWRVTAADLDLEVLPRVADQEMQLSLRYWEGAVDVRGSATGTGYVELTGYPQTGRQE